MKIAHLRFKNKKPVRGGNDYDRVVTVCYSVSESKDWLRYGATVYTKTNEVNWNKKIHCETAINRYNKNPNVVKIYHYLYENNQKLDPDYVLKWLIARSFIFKYGCEHPDYKSILTIHEIREHDIKKYIPDFGFSVRNHEISIKNKSNFLPYINNPTKNYTTKNKSNLVPFIITVGFIIFTLTWCSIRL